MISLHPTTDTHIDAYVANPPHALLVTGLAGSGVSTIAQHIAGRIASTTLTVLPEKDEVVDREKGTIAVQRIRMLYEQTRSRRKDSLVVVIEDADHMSTAAQNAFLKLLEEPVSSVHFILATHEPQALLATIHSRVQRLDIHPISRAVSESLLDTLGVTDALKRTQFLFIAEGLPAELTRLAADASYFERQASLMRDARTLLQGKPYEKLLIAHSYKDARPDALRLIDATLTIMRRSISSTPSRENVAKLEQLLMSHDAIKANGNVRLQLAALAIR